MSLLLDTDVVSELLRPSPNPAVEGWVAERPAAELYFSAVGEAELRYGVAMLPAGRRKDALAAAIEGILREDFRDRILPFDSGPPAHMQTSRLHIVPPAAPSHPRIARSLRSPVSAVWRWRRATSGTSRVSVSRSSIPAW